MQITIRRGTSLTSARSNRFAALRSAAARAKHRAASSLAGSRRTGPRSVSTSVARSDRISRCDASQAKACWRLDGAYRGAATSAPGSVTVRHGRRSERPRFMQQSRPLVDRDKRPGWFGRRVKDQSLIKPDGDAERCRTRRRARPMPGPGPRSACESRGRPRSGR
jgi:hypothetical protein